MTVKMLEDPAKAAGPSRQLAMDADIASQAELIGSLTDAESMALHECVSRLAPPGRDPGSYQTALHRKQSSKRRANKPQLDEEKTFQIKNLPS